jgi:hypothetical protein
MILKFTCPSFELDFAGKELNIVEENHWFNDQFFTKYSFPFEFDVDEDLDAALQMITHNNAARSAKTFEGFLQKFGGESEAILVIERIQGKKAQGKMRYGLEEFPNYNKKLSELPLEQRNLAEPIADHALNIINNSWPAVNYNFPQVIADKFDTDSLQWQYFEGIMNNYINGSFVLNEYDAENDEQINRNIMQPLPYLLYVIQQGFADAGLELTGDILSDPEFQHAVIVMISDYYTSSSVGDREVVMNTSEYDSIDIVREIPKGNYTYTTILNEPGRYRISGTVTLRAEYNYGETAIRINNDELIFGMRFYSIWAYDEKVYSVDKIVEISVDQGAAALNIQSRQLPYSQYGDEQNSEANIIDLTITKVAGFDQSGNLVPSLIAAQKINLRECVPDMTFGELLKAIKNWRNYDVTIGNGYAEMNKIKKTMDAAVAIDLTDTEVKEPIRNFYQDMTFLLQFQEVNSDEYEFAKLFVDSSGNRTSSFVKNDNTNEIIINAIPLPIKQVGPISTAHLFIDAKNILALSIYSGLSGGLNACRDTSQLLIPAVYESDWKEWIDFRINSEGFEWPFFVDSERAGTITEKSKIHAYSRDFIVRRVSKRNASQNWWEITLECDGAD